MVDKGWFQGLFLVFASFALVNCADKKVKDKTIVKARIESCSG